MERYQTPELKFIELNEVSVIFTSCQSIGEDPDKGFGNLHD